MRKVLGGGCSVLCVWVVLLAHGLGFGASQTWQDGEFGAWSFSSVVSAGTSASATITGGGNPGVCLTCTTVTGEAAWTTCMNPDATWQPSQAPIQSVSMSIDVKSISGWGEGQAIRMIAKQGGKTFIAPSLSEYCVTGAQRSWHRITVRACAQDDFFELLAPRELNLNSHPDFSQAGSQVRFGFMVGNRISGTYTQLYDNWSTTISFDTLPVRIQRTVPGVPGYRQRQAYTCGPTSAGMVVGYWDQFYPDLVPGSANAQTTDVDAMIGAIEYFAGTTVNGTNQARLIFATCLYSLGKGVPAVVWATTAGTDSLIQYNIDGHQPMMLFTRAQVGTDHFVAVDGYAGLFDPDTKSIVLTDLRIVDPGTGGRYWDQGGANPQYDGLTWDNCDAWRLPVRSLISYNPVWPFVASPANVLLGGTFDSQDDLALFATSGDGTAVIADKGPVSAADMQLVITTANEPMTLSQEGMFAAGQGFDLALEYDLSPQGQLDVLLDDALVFTIPGGAGHEPVQCYVNTCDTSLDTKAKHVLTLRLTGPAGTVLALDNLRATLRPYPDPLDRADLDDNGWIDLQDVALCARHWSETGCVEPDSCEGSDVNADGTVDMLDLLVLVETWLTS